MYKKHIVTAVAAAVVVGAATVDAIKVSRLERQKREQIRIETDKQIAAIRRAADIVEGKIHSGEYDRDIFSAIPAILNDHKFYTMTERFNEEN